MPTTNQTPTQARTYLDAALLQSVAESYLHLASEYADMPWHFVPSGQQARGLAFVLDRGSNHPNLSPGGDGATGLTLTQQTYFTANYEIVMHYPNDASGFSATLFRNRTTGEYTLSFRSTEYNYATLGGDWALDGKPGADGDIGSHGFALAQLASMEEVYRQLRLGNIFQVTDTATGAGHWVSNPEVQQFAQSPNLTVTGYSLGGHMATAFAVLHPEAQAYTFNAAGVGTINGQPPTKEGLEEVLHFYAALMIWDGEDATLPQSAMFPEVAQWLTELRNWQSDPGDTPKTPGAEMMAALIGADSDEPYQDRYRAVMEILDSHVGGTIGIGVEQQWDALRNYSAHGLDPNWLVSDKGEVQSWSARICCRSLKIDQENGVLLAEN